MTEELTTETKLPAIRDALVDTIYEFQTSPYGFLYERDIQGRMQAHLWNRLDALPNLLTSSDFRTRFNGPHQIAIHPVKLEWPLAEGTGRLDVAILAQQHWNTERLPWNQRAECAIEIKLWSDPTGLQYVE